MNEELPPQPELTGDELERLKSAFLSVISHELRTPLTKIMAAASILGDGYLGSMSEDQRKYLTMIEGSADELNRLIQDLIAFSHLQAQTVETQLETAQLNDIATAAYELHHAEIDQKKLRVRLRLVEGLPPLRVDRLKLVRVFSNLMSNAIKFNKEGGSIMLRTRAGEGGQYLDVADNGIGIPKEKQAHIFDSFYQVADPLTRQVGGLGIGLAYAQRIVKAHNGRLSVESVDGKGSLFSVWLPDSAPPEPASESTQVQPSLST